MKKVVLGGIFGVAALVLTSCGAGHGTCDAYRKADYTKYKAKQEVKIDLSKGIKTLRNK